MRKLNSVEGQITGLKEYRIVGGTAVEMNRYPWIVAMMQQSRLNYYDAKIDFRCTGSLIAPNVVISAAHCAGKVDYVQIDRYDLLNERSGYETFKIQQTVVHPSNLQQDLYNLPLDIALYILDGNSSALTLALNRNASLPGDAEPLIVLGYGANSSDLQFSPIPREAEVLYVPLRDCQSRYVNESIGSNTICALGEGTDACTGDSGGPLIRKGMNNESHDILMGTVSWGYACASSYFPGVYARISSGVGWIDDTVCSIFSPMSCINGKLTATTVDNSLSSPRIETGSPSIVSNNHLSSSTIIIIIVSSSVGGFILIAVSLILLLHVRNKKKAAQNLTYQEIKTPRRIFGRI